MKIAIRRSFGYMGTGKWIANDMQLAVGYYRLLPFF